MIDVGINFAGGKLCGDVILTKFQGRFRYQPCPRWRGNSDVYDSLSHVIKAMKLQKK